MGVRALFLLLCLGAPMLAQTDLLAKRSLDQWEVLGAGVWSLMQDGTLIGQYDLRDKSTSKQHGQAWLYTKKDFGEFDLHVEFWTRLGGNSGISIRDTTRARYAFGPEHDPKRTPSHNGYEIQILNGTTDTYPTGSVYLFAKAKDGVMRANDWNSMDIESRNDIIRVKVNGQLVAESPGDPARSKRGPIGLQLHDHESLVLFRNLRLKEK